MPSSRGPGRGYRRRMRRKAKLARLPALRGQLKQEAKMSTFFTTQHHPKSGYHFIPTERDVESDEAVWALYDRWCVHHNMNRTPEQRLMRFSYFKNDAIEVFEHNKKYPSDVPLFSHLPCRLNTYLTNFGMPHGVVDLVLLYVIQYPSELCLVNNIGEVLLDLIS